MKTKQIQVLKRYVILYLAAYLFCSAAMIMVYALPKERMKQHVAQSKEIFEQEGNYPYLISGQKSSQLDNFTDALMLLMASYDGEGPIYQQAFRNSFPVISGNTPAETLVRIHTDENAEYGLNHYTRYWHGYLLYLKPLLYFFSYRGIRLVWGILQILLTGAVLLLFVRRKMVREIVPFLAVYLFLDPAAMSRSLQHGVIYLLVVLQFLVILLFEDRYAAKEEIWMYHFFLTGCLTSFFDFLTYPLVTFGITGAFFLYRYAKAGKEGFRLLVKIFVSWSCGYVLFWAGKWVGASILLRSNILWNAAQSLRFRSGYQTADGGFSYIDVLMRNLSVRSLFFVILFFIVAVCVLIGKRKYHIGPNKTGGGYSRLLRCFRLDGIWPWLTIPIYMLGLPSENWLF